MSHTPHFIFDVDGTLTPSRSEMDKAFKSYFLKMCTIFPVYLVTGSDYKKTREQVGDDVLIACNTVYNCGGASIWRKNVNIKNKMFEISSPFQAFLNLLILESKYHTKTGKHLEFRPGLINLSTVGRNATKEQRQEYVKWDKETNERAILAYRINKFSSDYHASVAGETGIDITPAGVTKAQILEDFTDNQSLHFFGDRMDPEGNDYELSLAIKQRGGYTYHVTGWEQTYSILRELWGGW